jgi:hypothetical protein
MNDCLLGMEDDVLYATSWERVVGWDDNACSRCLGESQKPASESEFATFIIFFAYYIQYTRIEIVNDRGRPR